MAHAPVHMNGNLVCAIDCETTGIRPGYHDLVQLCIIPLGPDYTPSRELPIFNAWMQPKRPENADDDALRTIGREDYHNKAILHGLDPWCAVDRFNEWFEKLGLPMKKKIVPLGHNFPFDRDFIMEWLGGPLNYDAYFRSDFRDSMHAALYINDLADWHSERIPFPKVNLKYLCGCLQVELLRHHDAMADCVAAAECYRRLMRYKDFYKVYDDSTCAAD